MVAGYSAPAVRENPQDREQSRKQLDLIDDNQPLMLLEGEHRVPQARQILGVFQVVIDGLSPGTRCKCTRQSGFTHLPGANNAHHREALQHSFKGVELA